ncbi:hypothetical protein McanMca71_007790 [Microsporum canis]
MAYRRSQNATKATSFPQFRRLPVEMQIMIWEEAFYLSAPTQQVIEGYVQDDRMAAYACQMVLAAAHAAIAAVSGSRFDEGDIPSDCRRPRLMVFPAATRQSPLPALASVCHNSRSVVLKLGRGLTSIIVKGEGQGVSKQVWFDFSSDIVYFPNLSAEISNSGNWVSPDNWEYRRRIKHLAVEWSFFHRLTHSLYEDYRVHWLDVFSDLYVSFPGLTDLYIFVPAVRLAEVPRSSMEEDSSDREELWDHFEEPQECDGLPIVLKPIPGGQTVRLARCSCPERPRNWDETIVEIEIALRSQWLKESIQEDLGPEAAPNFPPRIHERIFLRKGLDVDALRQKKPALGLKVVVDRTLLGKKKDRM